MPLEDFEDGDTQLDDGREGGEEEQRQNSEMVDAVPRGTASLSCSAVSEVKEFPEKRKAGHPYQPQVRWDSQSTYASRQQILETLKAHAGDEELS